MASIETKTESVINDEENEDGDIGDEVTNDGKAVVAKKSKKKKKPKKPSKFTRCVVCERVNLCILWTENFLLLIKVRSTSLLVLVYFDRKVLNYKTSTR